MTAWEFEYEDLLSHYWDLRASGAQVNVPDPDAVERSAVPSFDELRDRFLRGEWKPDITPPQQPSLLRPDLLAEMARRAEVVNQDAGQQ